MLAAHKIDPALDSFYFGFILEMQGAPGDDLKEKFMYMLDVGFPSNPSFYVSTLLGSPDGWVVKTLGVDVTDTRYTDFSSVPREITAEYNRSRLEEAKGRRGRARESALSADEDEEDEDEDEAGDGDDDGDDEDGYTAEDELKESRRASPQKKGGMEEPPLSSRFRARSLGDPREDALKAAYAAARKRRSEIFEHRRAGAGAGGMLTSGSETERPSAEHWAAAPARPPEDLDRAAGQLHSRTVLRRYLAHWKERTVQLVVRRRFSAEQAVVFDRTTLLRQSFDIWQEKRWFGVLERRAGRRYDLVLLAKTWDGWVRRTAAAVQRTHEGRQRFLARKYFAAWRDLVRTQRRTVAHFQLSCALRRWTTALDERRARERKAAEARRENLAQHFYWLWYFRHLNVAVPQRYAERLAHLALCQWADRADRMAELHRSAEEFHRRRALQAVLAHWVQRTADGLERHDSALGRLDCRRLRAVFGAWRRRAALAPLVEAMRDVMDDRIAYETFSAWRTRTQNEIAAAEMYKQSLVRRTFRAWRLALRHRVMVEHRALLLRRSTLQQWTLQERLRLLARTHHRKLGRGVIQLFADKCREKSARLLQAYRQALLAHRRSLARRVFQWWYEKSQRSGQQQLLQCHRYRAALALRALNGWRSRLDAARVLESRAADACYFFTATHALARWRAAVGEARKDKLRRAYHLVSHARKRRTAQLALDAWRARASDAWAMELAAARFAAASVHDVARGILARWVRRTAKAADDGSVAGGIQQLRLLGVAFEAWKERSRDLREMDDTADETRHEHDLALVSKCLVRWDKKFWRVSRRSEDALGWLARNETKRVQSVFRLWRDKACQRRRDAPDPRRRRPLPLPAVDFGGDLTVLPLHGDSVAAAKAAVTPIRPFRTPAGWGGTATNATATTGGHHRRRGILGNRSLTAAGLAAGAGAMTPMGSPGSPLKRYGRFGKSIMLGKVGELSDEDEGTLVGSQTRTTGSQSTIGGV